MIQAHEDRIDDHRPAPMLARPGSRVVRNVRARGSTPPVFPTRGILFREPPDKSGPMLGTSQCTAKAYETRAMGELCHALICGERHAKRRAGMPGKGRA